MAVPKFKMLNYHVRHQMEYRISKLTYILEMLLLASQSLRLLSSGFKIAGFPHPILSFHFHLSNPEADQGNLPRDHFVKIDILRRQNLNIKIFQNHLPWVEVLNYYFPSIFPIAFVTPNALGEKYNKFSIFALHKYAKCYH